MSDSIKVTVTAVAAALVRLRVEMFSAGQLTKGEDLEEFNSLMSDLVDCFPPARVTQVHGERDAARTALRLAEEHNALLVRERDALRADCLRRITEVADAAQAEIALARSSVGSVPMADHATLINAVDALVGEVNEVLDVAGHYLTSTRRGELLRAIEAVSKAVG